MQQETPPATVIQLAAAMAALGAYSGENTEAEHAEEAERMGGGEEYYRMCLANGLLGVAETQVMLNETVKGPEDGMLFAHQQALKVAGATRPNALLLDFLRWRTLRIVGSCASSPRIQRPVRSRLRPHGRRKDCSCCWESPLQVRLLTPLRSLRLP